MKDVAEKAKVSVGAASRILRGDQDRFAQDTCDRVLEAARELGWRRNLLVNGIQTGRTQTVGVLIPPYDSFWVSILSGIHTRLSSADYLPITVWSGDLKHMPHFEADNQEGFRTITRLLDRRVDGIIMWPPFSLAYHDHFPELRERRVPVVVIDHRTENPVADTVVTNEAKAAKAIAKHILDLGHRRVACISSRETLAQSWALERRTSFEEAVTACGDVEMKSWRLNETGSNGAEVAYELLTDSLKPSAVFAVTDHEAAFVYEAAHKLGLKIPEDISVIGFADLDFAAQMSPPLTTVRQRPYEIGVETASLVLSRIETGEAVSDFSTSKIDADLVVRESTGPAKDRA
ncbi:LacI family DNA-binding transcriptional regulator [Pseudobythopirellula maris]|uniref:LacI family DNA-binding transcriptional regulator n=1 Tax=Pseudobythopirellula maris TaxID=2527991 RepID=UPI0018D39562|nr:LacI family DNA-binding transcriptional regulator [Pseudobythopirellula maris]